MLFCTITVDIVLSTHILALFLTTDYVSLRIPEKVITYDF